MYMYDSVLYQRSAWTKEKPSPLLLTSLVDHVICCHLPVIWFHDYSGDEWKIVHRRLRIQEFRNREDNNQL